MNQIMSAYSDLGLEQHYSDFIERQIEAGQYRDVTAVLCAGLKLLEHNEDKFKTLQTLLEEGKQSGTSDYSYTTFLSEITR